MKKSEKLFRSYRVNKCLWSSSSSSSSAAAAAAAAATTAAARTNLHKNIKSLLICRVT